MKFTHVRPVDEIATNILQKRYFQPDEKNWSDLSKRNVKYILGDSHQDYQDTLAMLENRYFIPNSPSLVNAGTKNGGLIACFVVDFLDTIEEIYKTKLEFAKIARKGGGCGTDLSHIRPENAVVNGSAHGYAGGPIKFFDTICHDMEAITQSGFRDMAMMGVMSVYHPDIKKFITSKSQEGKMKNTNISVMVDDAFMEKVKKDETFWTEFEGVRFEEFSAKEIYNMIIEGAWKNGEPGILFFDRINDSPYKYTNQVIYGTNPCGEQPLPPNGCCNLGSLDLSKFYKDGNFDYELFEYAIRLGVRYLDRTIDINKFPTEEIEQWAKENRPVGLGVMGLADYFLQENVAYGSKESLELIDRLFSFMRYIATDESEVLGKQLGVPLECQKLPTPRRNITVMTVAPTGTIALIAGCNSGIEPIFSEFTTRKDNTGTYQIFHPEYEKEYFRCAVASNGSEEVTWKEHILVQNEVQKYVDSGVSKTINFPNKTHRETIADSFMFAYSLGSIKGMTIYRNGSREIEVLSPKNIKKDKCPVCGEDLIRESGCKHCSSCDFSVCEIG